MPNEHSSRPSQWVVVVENATRGIDWLTIGPFVARDHAQAEAHRWRQPGTRAMVRYLWDGDDLRRDLGEVAADADA